MRSTYFNAVFLGMLVTAGCSASKPMNQNITQQFEDNIGQRHYHAAFRELDAWWKANKDDGEGAGYDGTMLFAGTAAYGESQWADILKDPAIALGDKHALVDEIDGYARRGRAEKR